MKRRSRDKQGNFRRGMPPPVPGAATTGGESEPIQYSTTDTIHCNCNEINSTTTMIPRNVPDISTNTNNRTAWQAMERLGDQWSYWIVLIVS